MELMQGLSWMFRKKNQTFATHVIRILLTGESWTGHFVSVLAVSMIFWHVVLFCQCGQNHVTSRESSSAVALTVYPWNRIEWFISQQIFSGSQNSLDETTNFFEWLENNFESCSQLSLFAWSSLWMKQLTCLNDLRTSLWYLQFTRHVSWDQITQ